MATKPTKQEEGLECGICHAFINRDEYRNHVLNCNKSDEDDQYKTAPSSPKSSVRPRSKNQIYNSTNDRTCPTCWNKINTDEFREHVQNCGTDSSSEPTNMKKENKKCPTCSETINANDLAKHIVRCDQRSVQKPTTRNDKTCPTCSKKIEPIDLADYMRHCDERSSRSSPVQNNSKRCPTCSKTVDTDDFSYHTRHCNGRSPRNPIVQKSTKRCPTCSETIDADEFPHHIRYCSVTQKSSRRCPTCSKTIDADHFRDHTYTCDKRSTRERTPPRTTQPCPVCSNEIPIADTQKHVNDCLEKVSQTTKSITCFKCSSRVDSSKNSSHTIPCRNKHIYCTKCLEQSMNEFIQTNNPPVCQPALCTYELSQYDVGCLPLPQDLITRVLPLVKSTQRPQCPSCFFYVEMKTMEDFQRHVISCNAGDMVPCEYCHCIFYQSRLKDHSPQCRNDSASQQRQALISFLLPRTKYLVTAPQMQVFLEQRRKNRAPLDARSIVDALAEYEGAFPYDVPTRDCDICTSPCVYDDIFVFGCQESHKTCYGCFTDSCKVKMNSKEVLTCPICAYQLFDGEIKQLQVPADQKREFLDYQLQKTFGTYASGERIIRCPNQKCKWVAEPRDPNERFQVNCPVCHEQFCSLCSGPYHFRTTCQQIPELTQRWFFWCNTERGNYWQGRAQHDANFRAQLDDYERQRAANEQRNNELRQRYNDLLVDENYKAQNCRICPHCGRVVERVAGCNSMVCGKNYHGGDVQSGCGQNFSWPQAAPYVPLANAGPQQVANDMRAPEQQKLIVHEGVRCDACGSDVQGIRFDCVHCPSLIFCEKCEQRATLDHSNEIRDQNKPQHVFQLITGPANATNRQ